MLPDFQNVADAAADDGAGRRSAARLYAAIPALLKTRFGTNEILTSLMLVYVAQLFLDWLVRGPWRDPKGFNFPNTITFSDAAADAPSIGSGRLTASAIVRARRRAWCWPSSSRAR